jgi:formylglycine-generating enzyme
VLGLLALGCGVASEHRPANGGCRTDERPDAEGRCAYATPLAVIRYATEEPRTADDYAFGGDALPVLAPSAGTTLYVSGERSGGFRGAALVLTWSVLDPAGDPLQLLPNAASPRASFVASARGEYSIALEARALDDPSLVGRAELHVAIDSWRCAPDGVRPPCATADPVPAGRFTMGSTDADGEASERPAHEVSVSGFALDRFEVTVGRFGRFFDAYRGVPPAPGAGAHPLIANSGWRSEYDTALPVGREQLELAFKDCGGTWYAAGAAREARPLNCVSWYEAFAFCIWDQGRLPTEAEWEYAAAGGSESRRYPWGEREPAADLAIFGCLFESSPTCTEGDLPPGGNAKRGAARFGQLDLAGSLWEWTLDQYAPYPASACADCAVLDGGEGRVFRGGGFRSENRSELRTAHRLGFLAEQRDVTRGFRCARSNGQ